MYCLQSPLPTRDKLGYDKFFRLRLLIADNEQIGAYIDSLDKEAQAALLRLCSAYLLHLSPTLAGDPVARFHLDNGARLERLNPRGNLSAAGLKQSFGLMVNYLYDLDKVETNHEKFKLGEVARSRAVASLL